MCIVEKQSTVVEPFVLTPYEAAPQPFLPEPAEAPNLNDGELVSAISNWRLLGKLCDVKTGHFLIEAKKRHGQHGEWVSWLQSTFKLSVRSAQRYMRKARKASLPKNDRVSSLNVAHKPERVSQCPNCGCVLSGRWAQTA